MLTNTRICIIASIALGLTEGLSYGQDACAPALKDQAVSGQAIRASSEPALGYLLPLGADLSVGVSKGSPGAAVQEKVGTLANGLFGSSVANAGDVDRDGIQDWIVGALGDGTAGPNAGKASVISGRDRTVLYAFNGNAADYLGGSVAGAGDVDHDGYADLLVGAFQGSAFPGKANVYSGRTGLILFSFSGNTANDQFGSAVASLADLDSDGYPDLAVGAPVGPVAPDRPGYVKVFSGANGNLLYQVSAVGSSYSFGFSIASIGDTNGDGASEFVVGDPGDSSNLGKVWMFSGINGVLINNWAGTTAGAGFGKSLAGAGDVNGDGKPDFLVGAPSGATPKVELRSGLNGSVLRTITETGGSFGYSVFGPGDLNGDGIPDILAGAIYGNVGGSNKGYVKAFSGANGSQLFQLDGSQTNELFGRAIARSGDFLLVGASNYDSPTVDAGRVAVYSLRGVGIGTTNVREKLTVEGLVASLSGGLKFPDGTVQVSGLPFVGQQGPQGLKGPTGAQGDAGPPANGVRSLDGSNGPSVTIQGSGAIAVTASGNNINIAATSGPTCTWAATGKVFSQGSICYSNVTGTGCSFGYYQASKRTCQSNGTWSSSGVGCQSVQPTPACDNL